MKKCIIIPLVAFVVCSSCSDSYYLSENGQDLVELEKEYVSVKSKDVSDNEGEKIETIADEAEIKASMDEYMADLMNRKSVAKERVTRGVYAANSPVVGVFKINSCGTYKELRINMDCEDSRSDSYTTGNVGASYVENGNVNLVFCLTDASRYYPGGVLLVDNINFKRSYTETATFIVHLDAFVYHHDAEDNNPSNSIYSDDARYKANLLGYSKIDNDVTLAWAFPQFMKVSMQAGSYYGAPGIEYGLLSTTNAATGTIHCDDEDHHNGNWMQRYKEGTTLDNSFDASTALKEYGVTSNGNTTYSVSLSNDPKFSKSNIYHNWF